MLTLTELLLVSQPPTAESHLSLPAGGAMGGGIITEISGDPTITILLMNYPTMLPLGFTDTGADIGIRPPRTQSPSAEGAELGVAELEESDSGSRSYSRGAEPPAVEIGEPSSGPRSRSRERKREFLLREHEVLEIPRRRREVEGMEIEPAQERNYRQRERERERSAAPSPVIMNNRIYNDSSDESDIEMRIRSSRNRSHYQSPSISSDEASEYEDFIASKVYEFRPSRSPSVALSVSEEGGSDRETPAAGSKKVSTSEHEKPQVSSPNTNLHIYESQYTGDAFIDGSHSAQLTVVQDPKRQRQPLFRWLHLKQAVLNLDQLSDEVTRDPELNDNDRKNVVKLLAEVRKNSKSKQKADGSHVKYMPPMALQSPLPSDDSDKSQETYRRWITWLCIPYFSLEEYSGLLSSKNPATYPNQTLWQAQYSGNAQERDMQQIVCQINKGSMPHKSCFHISQLWAIVLDTLFAETEMLTRLQEFVSHFLDFWPQTLQFLHHGQPVTERDWPRKYNLARHAKVTLSLTIIDPPKPPPRGILKPVLTAAAPAAESNAEEPKDELKPPSKGKETPQPRVELEAHTLPREANETFHVFTWLPHVQVFSSDRVSLVDSDALQKQMEEVDSYLKSGTSFSDKKAYQDCKESLRVSSFEYLEEQAKAIEGAKNKAQRRHEYEERIDILNAADTVFRLFLPVAYDGPTTAKYWGAVRDLVEMPVSLGNSELWGRPSSRLRRASAMRANAPGLRRYLRRLTQLIQSFEGLLSHAQANDREKVKIPDEFLKAWLHLLMGLVHSTQRMHLWRTHTDNAENLIKTGMRLVIDDLASHSSSSLLDRAALLPMELVSMACLTLFKDMTGTFRDISETYSDYLKALNSDITTKPSDRYTQHRISLLKAEISVIQKTLIHQYALCGAFFPTAPKQTSPSGLPGVGPPVSRTATVEKDRSHSIYERERSYSKSRSRRAPASYYDPSPGYQPAERTIVTKRVRESDPSSHRQRSRSHYDDDDGLFGADYTTIRDRYEDGDWTLHDSVLNPQESYKLNPTYWGGFRDMLATECVRLVQRRLEEFEQYDDYAKELERDNANKVDVTKGRQEMAIYAFTITTVIFLPLSAVSSIFGMNTNDIRNMKTDQWLYWATALPVTISVIIMGLWWMGELGNALRWLFRRERSYDYALGRPVGREVELLPGDIMPRLMRRQESPAPVRYVERRPGVVPAVGEAARPIHYRSSSDWV
ncbi:hypothetical protein DL769_007053 [Monosporascus sp. CRB-8-3]|nr:hypothetical protein DL769_007053 [Monosporascus sp. CRB-8-3]